MNETKPHSSIGEVLALLQHDYPDVTISKIRFLESQGLLNPERTPSGYRKFRDEDIVRLRWILAQQRDHFLPLKVIKERLAAGDFSDGPPEGVLPFDRHSESVPSDPVVNSAVTSEESVVNPTVASSELSSGSEVRQDEAGSDASPSEDSPPENSAKVRARAVASLVEGPAPQEGSRGRKRHPTGHAKGEPTPTPSTDPDPEVVPLALTREELCAQSGLSAASVGELERFGLLSARSMGHVEYYDDDALVVARLTAGFARFGIEPRHLRMYKVSADREAGLFEQLITPLLRQRRAEARDQAVEMLEELAELADDLRAVMVRASLREYLGNP